VKLALIKTGDTAQLIRDRYGDFDRMFVDQLQGLDLEIALVQAHRGDPLPKIDDVDLMIMTGSPSSVTKLEPWAESLAKWTSDLVDADKPVLGVCYGHQLLAHARGGRVEKNPRGYEIGTVEIELTREGKSDPLLGAVGRTFNSVHSDAVVALPSEAIVLATNAGTEVQAFAIGDRVWGVQFHPELTRELMEMYLEARLSNVRDDAVRRGVDPEQAIEEVRKRIRETPDGPRLLRRFVERAKELLRE
jgi:GMP synthase (glutamine-hydrolysing)